MRSRLLIAIVSIVPLAAVPAHAWAAPITGPAAKSKKATCKGGKVAVKIGKRSACAPFAKVFPKPKAIDLRLAYLRQALKFDPGGKAVNGKRRKRVRSLQSGFGAAGKRAQKKILGLLPKALAFFDRKRGGTGKSLFHEGPALASANCGVGQAGEQGTLGGSSTVRLLGDNGMYIETEAGHGFRVRVTFFSCGGVDRFRVPECPTGAGDVQAPTASGDFSATTEVWQGNQLKSRNSSRFEDESRALGKVGPDAKLKYVDVEHKQAVLVVASGGIVIRSEATHKVRIDMPGGSFDPDSATVLYSGDWFGTDLGAQGFSRSAKAAIDSYRQAEPRWSSFDRKPFCAQAVFSPAPDTIKVKSGEKKQLGIYARAVAGGGRAIAAGWTLTGALNAEFSPATSQEPAPTIQYTVTKAPQGYEVKVTARFTSTAGVGEDSWKQPIEGALPERFAATFSGTASYDETLLGEGNHLSADWSGNGELREVPSPYPPGTFPYAFAFYKIVSGSITYGFKGALGGCAVEGGGPIDLPSQPDLKESPVLTIFDKTPREYSFLIGMPLFAKVPGTQSGCKDPEEDGPIEFTPAIGVPAIVNAPLPGGPVGADWSISGNRSGDTGGGSPDQTWQWNLSPISSP
jgi:hypothetical protein